MSEVVHPDGSRRLVVPGVPADMARPREAEPSPWVETVYDENDLAAETTSPDGRSTCRRGAGRAPLHPDHDRGQRT